VRRGNITAHLDWLTVFIFLVLLVLGWLNIYSADYSEQHASIFDMSQRYGKQFLWILAAFAIAVTVILIDAQFYEFFAYAIYALAILLLIMVAVAGKEINGSRSWFVIGSFQIQPSEFAKPAVGLALAKYLSTLNISVTKFSTFVKACIIIFFPAGLILLQPDTGSAMVFVSFILATYREGSSPYILVMMIGLAILAIMVLLLNEMVILSIILVAGLISFLYVSGSLRKTLWVAFSFFVIYGLILGVSWLRGTEITYFFAGVLATIIGAVISTIVILMKSIRKVFYIVLTVVCAISFSYAVDYGFHKLNQYQQNRVNIMLGIDSDNLGAGYNLNQSKIAIGSGGFGGKGFLKGTQTKMRFVPEQSTDFIFCTVGEELGFVGASIIIVIFIFFFYRLIFLAERQRSQFARIYGYSIISVLFFHFTINIAMTIGLFPVVGIPLPFFSYGGSSLWSFTILLFIFLKLDASRMDSLA
jgi:rod shape determining protein RodA